MCVIVIDIDIDCDQYICDRSEFKKKKHKRNCTKFD